ncbi:MAG TPA: toll/interleukin-1 receptor domain-containing protein [Pyrinomonadaceae bacterium]|nr:toll/interleukin-1 receptor domain-containing protein [Pyrinomonadaceae bacterium]
MQIFLSYAESDEALARKVADGLEQAGLRVWYDRREILPGENWFDKTAKALRESNGMVVLLTPSALRSTPVRRAIEFALGEKAYSHRLIPVIVGPPEKLPKKELPWILEKLQTVNLPERGKQDKGIRQIAEALLEAA